MIDHTAVVPSRAFVVSILKKQTVILPSGTRRGPNAKSTTNSQTVPGPTVDLLRMDHVKVIDEVILCTLNGQVIYAASTLSGPLFSIFWKGLMYVLTHQFMLYLTLF